MSAPPMEPELLRAEEAVKRSEDRYRELLASVTDYIYRVRLRDGIVVGTIHGPGCLSVTGYRPEEYARDPDLWHRMVHPDDTAAVVAKAAEMAAKVLGENPEPTGHPLDNVGVIFLSDPDGNGWAIQQMSSRGRRET